MGFPESEASRTPDLSSGIQGGTHPGASQEENPRWLRSILQNSSEIVKVVDPDGKLRYASPAFERIFGYGGQRAVGMNVLDHVHPDDLPRVLAASREALAGNGITRNVLEYRFQHADGSWRHVESSGTYLLEDPAVRGVLVTVRDVTQRREAEQALRESETMFRAVFDKTIIGMSLVDVGGVITRPNAALSRLLGYEEQELEGKHLSEVTHPEDVAEDEERFRRLTGGGLDHFTLEKRYVRKDGGLVWGRSTSSAVRDEDGDIRFVVAMVEDVTGRKEVMERLREAEVRYRSLVENVPAMVYIEAMDGRMTTLYDSPQIEKMLGYPADTYKKDPNYWANIVHPEDKGRVAAEEQEAIAQDGSFHSEYRVMARDGRVVWVRDESVVVRDGEGTPLYWQGVILDVTARREAEAALKESEERHRRQSAELALLHRVRTVLARELDPLRVLQEAVEAVAKTYGYTQVAAYLREGNDLVLQHQVGYEHVIQRFPVERGICGRAVRTGEPIFVEDVGEDPGFLGSGEDVTSEICVPFFWEDGAVAGFFNVESRGGIELTHRDLELLVALGEHISVAVSRARLYSEARRSELRYRTLTQNSSDVVTLLGADGLIHYQSPSIERVLGYGPEESVGESAFSFVHPDDVDRVRKAFAGGLGDPTSRPVVEYRFRHKAGTWRWLESVGANLLDTPGLGEFVVNSRDITERKLAERSLKESEQRFRRSFRDAAIGMVLVSPAGRFLQTNRAFRDIVGYGEGELLSMTFLELTHPDDVATNLAHFKQMLAGEIDAYQVEKRYVHSEGHGVWAFLSASVVRDDGGEPVYFVCQIQDITERKMLGERLHHRAFHDPLTELPNRQLFVDRLAQAHRRAGRRSPSRVAVLFMDIDGFKVVNDSLGHRAGDLLLVVVSQRLRRCLRPEDTLARFGGDEFVVLLEDVEGPEHALRVAKRIAIELQRPFAVDGRELFVSVSVGIALGDAQGKDPEDLVRDADTAMYRAKAEGTGYAIFDPTMYERAVRRLELENDLRRATENDDFVVHYQPIVDLRTGETWGVEALTRWNHPVRGLLDPAEFVPAAEESGLILPMGERVLEAACREAKKWEQYRPEGPPLIVSVNLSARQLGRPDLADKLEETLTDLGLQGGRLCLDVTETVYVKALEANTRALDRIRRMGVRISIDDFGTGYSSLSYLKHLPADTLKIDRSFVNGLGVDPGDTAIVRTIIELAHTLGMAVVAEGVERPVQTKALQEMGCDLGQGYHFSRPLPSEEVPEFLAR